MKYDVADLSLSRKGKLKIEWAGQQMGVLRLIKQRFEKEKPLDRVVIGACLHVTSETANLMISLKAGGARPFLCASNPLSTQDEIAASLVKDYKIPVFAKKGEDDKTYYQHIQAILDFHPQVTMDDGADIVASLHRKFKIQNSKGRIEIIDSKLKKWEFFGSSEETTTGVIRLRAMEKDKALRVPVIAVNDSQTKYLFDNRYGTGQSTIDGILRATHILLSGKNFVVAGYGWCARGIAMRAKGMGAKVIICEVDPIKALEAAMDGFWVMKMNQAVKAADVLVTSTGDKNVVNEKHLRKMKNGAILANAGHFNVEVNLRALNKLSLRKRRIRAIMDEYQLKDGRRLYLLGEGRLVNLTCAEGHPAEVMDMSFSNQALAAEFLVKKRRKGGKLKSRVYRLPEKIDKRVARLKLKAMGIKIDRLTKEQRKYLTSWREGT